MREEVRHRRIWKALYPHVHSFCAGKYGLQPEPVPVARPYLLIANHATNLDALFIAMAVGKSPIRYVGSEHIMRRGRPGRLLRWALGYIARPKASSSFGTVREILKTLKTGTPVCLFAEGNCSWDGRNVPVVDGTGSLVKASGVPLVTYRLEGNYLCRPRWSRSRRKGVIQGRVVGVYPPERLAGMTGTEINQLIDRDIREDAWERPPVARPGRHRAEYLERFLYLCPGCRRISTLRSRGNLLTCSCGQHWTFPENAFLQPSDPFATLAQWEDWQRQQLRTGHFVRSQDDGALLFSDAGCTLSRVDGDRSLPLDRGVLKQQEHDLICGSHRFSLSSIQSMDMVMHHLLLFSVGDAYYEIRARGRTNLRKYLENWLGLKAADASCPINT